MNRIVRRSVVPLLVSVACLLPAPAGAGVHIGIGFGTVIGPHHPGHHWHSGWAVGPGWYWYDPWCDPWYGWYPVVVEPPVVVERHVVVKERKPSAPAAPQPAPNPDPLSEKQQQERSELLKKLRIGDIKNRIQAVNDLGRLAHDDKTRTALQDALLSDRDAVVRKAVAELFGRLQDKRTLPTLKRAHATDSDRDVRQAAYKAMILIEGYQVDTN